MHGLVNDFDSCFLVQFAERKYGEGINSELLQILAHELQLMYRDDFDIEHLDESETFLSNDDNEKNNDEEQLSATELATYAFCSFRVIPMSQDGKIII